MDDWIIKLIAQSVVSGIVFAIYNRYSKKRRIYCNDDGWQPISSCPDEPGDIIITDGENVRSSFIRDYDKDGSVVLGYPHKKATHWRRYPFPPMEKEKD